jgi:hypothetical protein
VAKSKKETPEEAAKRERSRILEQRRNKAKTLRRKVKAGAVLTADEQAWLDAYAAEPHGNARTPAERPGDPVAEPELEPGGADDPGAAGDTADASPEGGNPPAEAEPPPAAPVESAPIAAAPPPPPKVPRGPAPIPPTPPRTRVSSGTSGDESWLSEFGGGPGLARRQMCVEIAGQWRRALRLLSAQIVESGGSPMIDVDDPAFFGLLVRATHDVIPKDLVLTPAMEAAGASTMLLAQRALRHKKWKLAKADAAIAAQRYSAPARPVPPPPAPSSAAQPAAEPRPGLRVDAAPIAKPNGVASADAERVPSARPGGPLSDPTPLT